MSVKDVVRGQSNEQLSLEIQKDGELPDGVRDTKAEKGEHNY